MLVAHLNGERVVASRDGEKGLDYRCPNPDCRGPMILKPGRIVTAHYAHKPPATCAWSAGETIAHLEAKSLFRDALTARGLKVEVECIVDTLPGDRRADVLVTSPSGERVAIELQHTSIGLEEIEARAFAYARAGIAQIWVPFLRAGFLDDATRLSRKGDWRVDRYAARPFERWIHGFGLREIWFYDPREKWLWRGLFQPHHRYVEYKEWYTEDGDEMMAGGYWTPSKRWRELYLSGPYRPADVRVRTKKRTAFVRGAYAWPAGRVASFVPWNDPA